MKTLLTILAMACLSFTFGQNTFNVLLNLSANKEDSITFVYYKLNIHNEKVVSIKKEFERVVENKDQIQTLTFPENESWSVSIVNRSKQVIKYVHVNNSGPGNMTFPREFIPDFSITDQLEIAYNPELKKYEYLIFRY
jgi:hypothetical protein